MFLVVTNIHISVRWIFFYPIERHDRFLFSIKRDYDRSPQNNAVQNVCFSHILQNLSQWCVTFNERIYTHMQCVWVLVREWMWMKLNEWIETQSSMAQYILQTCWKVYMVLHSLISTHSNDSNMKLMLIRLYLYDHRYVKGIQNNTYAHLTIYREINLICGCAMENVPFSTSTIQIDQCSLLLI